MHRKLLGLLALTVALAACDDGSTGADAAGTMSLYLTDAPGDFHQAIVQIERIELVGEDDESGLVLMDGPYTTDLLTLSNDVATLVEDVVVPPGTYGQLRFIIPAACIVVEAEGEGTTEAPATMVYASDGFTECGEADGALQLPSFSESGLKVSLPESAQEVNGDAYLLLLDFDVSRSFGQMAGASGMWVMTPHIVADEVSLTGSVTVALTEAEAGPLADVGGSLEDFEARLDTEEAPVPFQDDDGDGTWTATFLFLMPGESYEASVGLPEGFTDYEATVELTSPSATVELTSGGSPTVAFEVTGVTPPTS